LLGIYGGIKVSLDVIIILDMKPGKKYGHLLANLKHKLLLCGDL
jgi:hypothetical protein